jgi:hypothetical protein
VNQVKTPEPEKGAVAETIPGRSRPALRTTKVDLHLDRVLLEVDQAFFKCAYRAWKGLKQAGKTKPTTSQT